MLRVPWTERQGLDDGDRPVERGNTFLTELSRDMKPPQPESFLPQYARAREADQQTNVLEQKRPGA